MTLLVLFKNIEHLINALNMEHIKHIQYCFVHQNLYQLFQFYDKHSHTTLLSSINKKSECIYLIPLCCVCGTR